jgi:hypothetical protein
VIAEITAPSPICFEEINSSGLLWLSKSALLFMMVAHNYRRVRLLSSYLEGRILVRESKEDVSDIMRKGGHLDDAAYQVSVKLEKMLDSSYERKTQIF